MSDLDFQSKKELIKAGALRSNKPGQFSLPSIEQRSNTSGLYYDTSIRTGTTSQSFGRFDGILSYEMMRLIAKRSGVVKPAVDFITRSISTTPYRIQSIDGARVPKKAIRQAEELLIDPLAELGNVTFRDLLAQLMRDIVLLDHGIMLKHRTNKSIDAIEIMDAATFLPMPDKNGRLKHWIQRINDKKDVKFDRNDIVHFMMNPRSDSLYGEPAMEAVVHEINATLNASKSLSHAFDRNEIPPGILFLLGVNDTTALQRFQREIKIDAKLGNNDYALRTLSGMDDAKWIPFQKQFREMQVAELMLELQRTVWRAFGVDRLAMSDVTDVNRAAANALIMTRNFTLFKPMLDMLSDKLTYQLLRDIHPGLYIEFIHYARTGEAIDLTGVRPTGIEDTYSAKPLSGKAYACGGCRGRASYDFTINGEVERIKCPDCDGTGVGGPLFVSRPQRAIISDVIQTDRTYRRKPSLAWNELASAGSREMLDQMIELSGSKIQTMFESVSSAEDLIRVVSRTQTELKSLFKKAFNLAGSAVTSTKISTFPSREGLKKADLFIEEFVRFQANPRILRVNNSESAAIASLDLQLDAVALCRKAVDVAGSTLVTSITV